jgi:hypothetical protein
MGPFKDSYGREYLQLYGPNGRPTERDYAGSEDTFLLNQKNSSSLTQDLLGNSSYGHTSYPSDNFTENNSTVHLSCQSQTKAPLRLTAIIQDRDLP